MVETREHLCDGCMHQGNNNYCDKFNRWVTADFDCWYYIKKEEDESSSKRHKGEQPPKKDFNSYGRTV